MGIKRLANTIKDVTDPSSFDKVLEYHEDIQLKADNYMELLVSKLDLYEVNWEQPWYQDDTALTRLHQPFYDRNKSEIESERFRTDKISKEEHNIILLNWNRFTEEYNVPGKLRIFACWKSKKKMFNMSPEEKTKRFIMAYLAKDIKRTLHQLYRYIKYFNFKDLEDKKYNRHEEKIIEVCFMHRPSKAPLLLASVLGRHVRGLYKRGVRVPENDSKKKKRTKWNKELSETLVKMMLKYTELPLDELKYRTIDKSVWLKIEEAMKQDYANLHYFWHCYLHVQLFVKCDVKRYKLRRKIFKLLRDSSYRVWSDIRWAEVVKQFPDGFTPRFLYTLTQGIMRKYPNYLRTPLGDLANFGLKIIKSYKYRYNKRLKRYTLNDEGNLELIRYNPDECK